MYRVKNWAKLFEVAQTRKILGPLDWVAVPTKHDGKSFRRLMARVDGLNVYACWHLILQVSAKCTVRGQLSDSDGALTAEDLFFKTGAPKQDFEKAFNVLCSQEIGWLERIENPLSTTAVVAKPTPVVDATTTGHNITGQDITLTDICAEIKKPISTPSPSVLTFECDGKQKTWELIAAKLQEFQQAFPSLDVMAEFRQAALWLRNNPAKKKTYQGMPAFLTRWLGSSQNRGTGNRTVQGSQNLPLLPPMQTVTGWGDATDKARAATDEVAKKRSEDRNRAFRKIKSEHPDATPGEIVDLMRKACG